MRGRQYREAIRAVLQAFGPEADDLVFLGSCALGLHSRRSGGPLRLTTDVRVASTATPWSIQEERLADLCDLGILTPDPKLAFRHHVVGTRVTVDVLSPQGMNVENITEWFRRAVARAARFELDDNTAVRGVTPPYLMALALEAWRDRGKDPRSDTDAEDLVAVATEVIDLVDQVEREGIGAGIGELWRAALARHELAIEDMADFVSWHLHPIDAAEEDRVVASLRRCAEGA